jgi:hypothetical protein
MRTGTDPVPKTSLEYRTMVEVKKLRNPKTTDKTL